MERDCLVAHGVSDFLLERLMLVSDAFDVYVCGKCGNFATPPARDTHVFNLRANCRVCESTRHVVKLCVPYACKLLIQELAGMHVGVRLLRS
jgi:DNA-directed RNA polymerase III subunit RPC2